MKYTAQQIEGLFGVVKQSIALGLQGESFLRAEMDNVLKHFSFFENERNFEEPVATFVTLHHQGRLRGCIGTLQAHRPLLHDVVANSYSAAFRDPRFLPLGRHEQEGLEVEISILTKPEPIENCSSRQDLLSVLTPFKDGLILTEGVNRATFLPSVWEQLPETEVFVDHLMHKAGIHKQSSRLQCERYYVDAYQKRWEDIVI